MSNLAELKENRNKHRHICELTVCACLFIVRYTNHPKLFALTYKVDNHLLKQDVTLIYK